MKIRSAIMLLAGSFFGLPITGNSQEPYIRYNTLYREESSVWAMCPQGQGNAYQQQYISIAPGWISWSYDQQTDCPDVLCAGWGRMTWNGFGVSGEGYGGDTCFGPWSGPVEPFEYNMEVPPWREGYRVRQDPSGETWIGESASLDLVTGDSFRGGPTNVHKLVVSAWDTATGIAIPSDQIVILGKVPNENGAVFALLEDYTIVDATPLLPADPIGISYTVTVSKNPLPSIWWNGQDVTGKTNVLWVGERVALECRFGFASDVTNYQWWVPSLRFADYVTTATNNQLIGLTNLTGASVGFFWTRAGTWTVSCTIKVAGHTMTAKATFEVRKPEADFYLLPQSHVQVTTNFFKPNDGDIYYLTTGNFYSSNDVGMRIRYIMRDLKGYPEFEPYSVEYAQIAEIGWTSNVPVVPLSYWLKEKGNDGGYPYHYWGMKESGFTDDTPHTALQGDVTEFFWRRDDFDGYLMWRSLRSGVLSVPVPLKVGHWSWWGRAQLTDPNSVPATFVGVTPYIHPQAVVGSNWDVPPMWTNVLTRDNINNYWRREPRKMPTP